MKKRKGQRVKEASCPYALATEKTRLNELKALGIVAGALKLSGRRKYAHFQELCRMPTKIYTKTPIPLGPRLVPMWESAHSLCTTLARMQDDGTLEIIEHNLESPSDWQIVAHSEQGILAHCFLHVLDLEISFADSKHEEFELLRELKQTAKQFQFLHFDDTVSLVKSKTKPAQLESYVLKLK